MFSIHDYANVISHTAGNTVQNSNQNIRTSSEAHTMNAGAPCPQVLKPGEDDYHSPHSDAQVNNKCHYTTTAPVCLHDVYTHL